MRDILTALRRAARCRRPIVAAMAAVVALTAFNTDAAASGAGALGPSSAFVQIGAASHTDMAIVGATWDWSWYKDLSFGRLGGYWEASFGRWNSHRAGQDGTAWVTQLGVTPVLRLYPTSWGGRWFMEAGIGANVLLPIYRSRSKRFSTAFNFGDHLALGRRFGESGKHELALRLQHFSNAGIKEPNPGENFVQVRYSWRF
jgi:hypothetical protein